MFRIKKEKTKTPEEIKKLIEEKKKLVNLLEQNRVLGIKEENDQIKTRLDTIQSVLEKENVFNEEEVPFGGLEMDGGNLKNKTTEELLRIQTVQLQKILQQYSEELEVNQKFRSILLYRVLRIYLNIQFFFWLTIISMIILFFSALRSSI